MYTTAWLNEASSSLAKDNHVLFLPFFSLTEAVDEMSHDDTRDAIYTALKAITPQKDGYYSWVREVFDDFVIYQEETPSGTKLYRRDYSINAEGECLFGTATEVEEVTEYVPVGEAVRRESSQVAVEGKIIDLIEVSVRPDNTIPLKIIEPGWGSSAYYDAEVLERDGPKVFTRGTHMHWDHPTETEEAERPEGSLDSLAAVLAGDAHWEPGGPKGPGLYADAEVFTGHREAMDELAPHIGVSIKTTGTAESGERDGRTGPILTELLRHDHTSVDFVTKPGAGGQVLQLFESARHKPIGRAQPMPEELKEAQDKLTEAKAQVADLTAKAELTEADRTELARLRERQLVEAAKSKATELLKDTELLDATKLRITESASANPPVTEAGELDEAAFQANVEKLAEEEATYLSQVEASGIKGMGGSGKGEDDGKKALRESAKFAHPDWSEEQVENFVNG